MLPQLSTPIEAGLNPADIATALPALLLPTAQCGPQADRVCPPIADHPSGVSNPYQPFSIVELVFPST